MDPDKVEVVNFSVQASTDHGSLASVGVGAQATLITRVVTAAERITSVLVSADRHSLFTLQVNASTKAVLRTTSDSPTAQAAFLPGIDVLDGDTITILVDNLSDQGATPAEATLVVMTA